MCHATLRVWAELHVCPVRLPSADRTRFPLVTVELTDEAHALAQCYVLELDGTYTYDASLYVSPAVSFDAWNIILVVVFSIELLLRIAT